MLRDKKQLSPLWQKARRLRKKATLEERILWEQLKNKKLFSVSFRRQYVIGRFVADFYSHKAKLIIELDGSQHAEIDKANYDSWRTKYFEQKGLEVVRFWNDEIQNNLSDVVDYLQLIIERRQHKI